MLFSALHPSELILFLEREKVEMIRKIQKQQEAVEEVLPALISLENNIHIKAIMPENEDSKARSERDDDENRESILIPKEDYEFSPEINIYNNKVLITSWRETIAILIESEEIADFHRKMYQLCWERAGTFQSKSKQPKRGKPQGKHL